MTKQFIFSKVERLSHKNHIDALFNEGKSFSMNPFKIIYRLHPIAAEVPVKVLFAVSKKKFKRAVDRNRLRRIIREAYRLNKHLLVDQLATIPCSLHMGFVYVSDRRDVTFAEIEKQMVSCLERLGKIVGSSSGSGS